ncbi:NUDIX hydrolase [Peribacillus kribbensis]|uniref:NUDIX hydrolase n=1 Tax=Peribacillus kribbensis TaxID=356658 RepID=UPI0003F80A47|nr:NUDIX hydrolase [Peribacillus kribbensis]
MEEKWLEWAKKIQALSQAGLAYSKDIYDIERFQELRTISCEMVSELTQNPFDTIQSVFASETGYQTPKTDIRAVIFQEDRLLLVKEKEDQKWSLPGGWADIGLSPAEVAVKEVQEETGLEVQAVRLLAVLDKKCHPHPPSLHHVYKLFFECSVTGGHLEAGIETADAAFFSKDALPELSPSRITRGQLELLFSYLDNPGRLPVFD